MVIVSLARFFIDMSKKPQKQNKQTKKKNISPQLGIEFNNISNSKKKKKISHCPSLIFHQDLPAVLLKIHFPYAQCAFHFIFLKTWGGFGGSLWAWVNRNRQRETDQWSAFIFWIYLPKNWEALALLVKAFGYWSERMRVQIPALLSRQMRQRCKFAWFVSHKGAVESLHTGDHTLLFLMLFSWREKLLIPQT